VFPSLAHSIELGPPSADGIQTLDCAIAVRMLSCPTPLRSGMEQLVEFLRAGKGNLAVYKLCKLCEQVQNCSQTTSQKKLLEFRSSRAFLECAELGRDLTRKPSAKGWSRGAQRGRITFSASSHGHMELRHAHNSVRRTSDSRSE